MPSLMLEPSAAELALRRCCIPALARVVVEETAVSVVLTGTVPTYYLKQLAQEVVRPTLEGRQLANRIEVVRGREV
jgi:hypothetical protein